MAGRVVWHRHAEEDLAEAYLFLGADSPAMAERLLDAVEVAVQFLFETPAAGRQSEFRSPDAQGIRSWIVQGFPAYLIFYRAAGGDLEVVRFIHGARDIPGVLEWDT